MYCIFDKFKQATTSIRHNVAIIFLFLLLFTLAFLLQKYGNNSASSLGANLLSEFIGAAVTVFGIDFLIRQREEKRLLPVRASVYEDVRIMTHWALDIWKSAYDDSVGDAGPRSWKELFSEEYLHKISVALDIRKKANVIPATPWGNYIENTLDKIHKHAEKILERHGSALDAEIYNAVFTVVYYDFHHISQTKSYDQLQAIPRPTNLGGYMPFINEWFEAIIDLHEWTLKTHTYLDKKEIKRIHPPYLFRNLEVYANPRARLSIEELSQQIQEFKLWQDQQTVKRNGV